ncbi:MAG: hypothetical protein PWQ57_3303 [Desulfovibrionales bacterium]|jgi:hypothetical protein|nr:hypothetical protein [Desulfovibrionales bacterium]
MEIEIYEAESPLPINRAYSVSIIIKSFKGRRDVEAHLFRPQWDSAEEKDVDWAKLLGSPMDPSLPADPLSTRKVIMESFTVEERDQLVLYLSEHYDDRLTALWSAPLEFPAPMGLPALSDVDEDKSIGFIRFEKIPHFHLPFPVHALYDLSRHRPLVEEAESLDS